MSARRWLVPTAATVVVLIAVSLAVVAREADAWWIVSFDWPSPCC